MDVTNDESVSTAIVSIVKSHGRIDVLLNNAGVMNVGVTEAYSSAELQAQFEINTFGPARTIRAVLPTMREQKSGLLVSFTSLAGRVVFPFFGAYYASKFALEALAVAHRYELSGLGIDSVVVEPGPLPSGLLNNLSQPLAGLLVGAYAAHTDSRAVILTLTLSMGAMAIVAARSWQRASLAQGQLN